MTQRSPDSTEKALYELERLSWWHSSGISAVVLHRLERLAKSHPWPLGRVEEAVAHLLISLARASTRIRPNSPLDRELVWLASAYAIVFLRFEDLIRSYQLEESFMEEVQLRSALRDKRSRTKAKNLYRRTAEQWLEMFSLPELNARQLGELCWMQRREPSKWARRKKAPLLKNGPNGGFLRRDYISFLESELDKRESQKIRAVLVAYNDLKRRIK